MFLILLFLVALLANTLSAFAGGGAGLVQFPALIFLGLPFPVALATHKIATVALGLGSIFRYLKEKKLDFGFSLYMLLCGVTGALLGANVILKVDESLAKFALGFFMLLPACYSAVNSRLGLSHSPKHRNLGGLSLGGIVLFFIGFLNGSLTSGTGLLVTLWLVVWFGFEYKLAVAYTMVLVGFFWNASGAIALALIGEVQWDWLPALLVGSLLGGYLGAHLGLAKGSRWVKKGFEAVTFLMSGILIYQGVAGILE